MYQNESILENKNETKTFNKLKITHYFQNYSKLLMKSLGIQPVEKCSSKEIFGKILSRQNKLDCTKKCQKNQRFFLNYVVKTKLGELQ